MAKGKKTGQNNFIGEWFGVPLYPKVICSAPEVQRLAAHTCPFLSEALQHEKACIKKEAALGVCSIVTPGPNTFMVCPYRALDHALLLEAARDIFGEPLSGLISAPSIRAFIESKPAAGDFAFYFQDKLGGEISLPGTDGSPEISLDLTFVRARYANNKITLRDYGCMEAQTMDFHGSYSHAVGKLRSVLDTHRKVFAREISRDIAKEWLSKEIEGPNIANVFKRTFYQALLKFTLAGRDACRGVVLALPLAVWNSWKPHLGGVPLSGLKAEAGATNTWILIFDLRGGKIVVVDRIHASAKLLAKAAFEVASENMAAGPLLAVKTMIADRVKQLVKRVAPKGSAPEVEWAPTETLPAPQKVTS